MNLENLWRALAANPAARALLFPAVLARRNVLKRRARIRDQVVQNLRQSLAADPVLRIDEFDGKFSIDPRSHLFARIANEGHYEPELAACCAAHLDRTRDALDIGANVGFYSNLLARRIDAGRRVLSVEPTKGALARLRANMALNGTDGKIVVFPGVASNVVGELTLNTIEGREEYSSLGAMAHPSIVGQSHAAVIVQSSTVDKLVQQHQLTPGFMKIDVEGFEAQVLDGARETLKVHRPVVLAELSDTLLRQNGSSASAVVATMRELDYEVSDPLNPHVRVGTLEFGDMLCIPKAR